MSAQKPTFARRFYEPDLREGRIDLLSDQAHHALNVLRLTEGAPVTLFDGAGGVAEGLIVQAGRKGVAVVVDEVPPIRIRPAPIIELAFAIPKGRRIDWLLEKATELGAAVLQPVVFERSAPGGEALSAGKRQRWSAHCIGAARQCELDFLPTIHPPTPLAAYLAACDCECRLVGDVDQTVGSLSGALQQWRSDQRIAILVGPEGDLTDSERAAAREGGFRAVHLGHTVLRVETAAVALMAGVVAVCDRPEP